MDTQNILSCIAIALIEYRGNTAQDVDDLFNLARYIYEEQDHENHKPAIELATHHAPLMIKAEIGDN